MLDQDRIVTCDAKLVDKNIPASPGVVGGLEVAFQVDNTPMWTQRVRILLNQRPAHIPKWFWRWMLKTIIVQETNYNA